jgi:hypothetical protein
MPLLTKSSQERLMTRDVVVYAAGVHAILRLFRDEEGTLQLNETSETIRKRQPS